MTPVLLYIILKFTTYYNVLLKNLLLKLLYTSLPRTFFKSLLLVELVSTSLPRTEKFAACFGQTLGGGKLTT